MTRPALFPDPGPVLDRIYDELPDHYREADEQAPFPSGSRELPALTNFQKNPSGESNSSSFTLVTNECVNPQPVAASAGGMPTGWTSGGAGATSGAAPWDSSRTAARCESNGTNTPYIFSAGAARSWTVNTHVVVRAKVLAPAGVPYQLTPHLRSTNRYFNTTTSSFTGTGSVETVTAKCTLDGAVSANDLDVALLSTESGTVAGRVFWMGDVEIYHAATTSSFTLASATAPVASYFDGSTPAADDSTNYTWGGTANASTSRLNALNGLPGYSINSSATTLIYQGKSGGRYGPSTIRGRSIINTTSNGIIDGGTYTGGYWTPMTAGQRVTHLASMRYRGPDSVGTRRFYIQFIFYDAAGASLGQSATQSSVPASTDWVDLRFSAIAPANTAYVRTYNFITNTVVGDQWDIDGRMSVVTDGSLPAYDGPYFDGDTTGEQLGWPGRWSDDLWSWTGTPHASWSTQAHRPADPGGYPLYRWLAGPVSQLGLVDSLLTGIDYDDETPGDTSTLTDPNVAPVEWLPWLAQLVGVYLRPDLTDTEKRDAVRFASAGWRAGTKAAVADAAKSELTGTKFARVYDHSITQPGDGGQWDVLIITRSSETPDVNRVLQAVTRRAAKPAGVVLHHRAYESTWDTVSATYPTWVTLEGAGQWNKIQEAGL